MKQFATILKNLPEYGEIKNSITSGNLPLLTVGLSHIHKAHLIYSLSQNEGITSLVITPDEASANRLCDDINGFFGEECAVCYPEKELWLRDVESISREYEHKRLQVLGRLVSNKCKVVVASVNAAVQFTTPPNIYKENTFSISFDQTYEIQTLIEKLVNAGYERRVQVEGTCQFSVRGGILDIFPPDLINPVRIEFFGDEIDTMAFFDLNTQRRLENVELVNITPAQEILCENAVAVLNDYKNSVKNETFLKLIERDIKKLQTTGALSCFDKYLPIIYKTPATLFDYAENCVTFLSEYSAVRENIKNADKILNEDVKLLFEDGVLAKGLDKFKLDYYEFVEKCEKAVILETFAMSLNDLSLKNLISVDAMQISAFSGDMKTLEDDLRGLLSERYFVGIFAGSEKGAQILCDDLKKLGLSATKQSDISEISLGKIAVLPFEISGGMQYPKLKFAAISIRKNGDSNKKGKVHRKIKDGKKLFSISDITPGDYVVHVSHGIGVFEGIQKLELEGIIKDYIKIRYSGTDTLYVPVTQLDLVAKYIAPGDDKQIKLNRLNSAQWQQTKARVKSAVKSMAKELTALYAARLNQKGFQFDEDNDWQMQFEAHFPYDETDDQLRCISEIKADMQSSAPMDRLLCGDVGFGKTEVALRAAFKCVLNSKQCAILVPTTILAWQHYQTIVKRMDTFPVNVELLSRFRTPKQQEKIIKKLNTGEIDIVVGTHRLVQNDVKFKDLGLVIIDEEQRFGVKHKEKLKEIKKNVDVLTLSATPIPRTLNMAMSGIRDMSVINEAPSNRYPVQTYVMEYNEAVIADAIRRELRRGGQVFYLHNHIDSIDSCASRVAKMAPDATVAYAHGRMGEEEISDIWRKLLNHEIDILVCTTIIESGIDVPNCNTLIVENADNMGLSQLYQLRGRVGRASRRAYAYLTFTRGKVLSEIATKRLSAMREFTQFGSGFHIAMRDLEIRGAGSILGGQQHGHMESVGYDMYVKLLARAIAEEKGEVPEIPETECVVDIRIPAHIPEKYISDVSLRIEIYRKIAAIKTEDDAIDVTDEIIDRFGDIPQSVKGLIDVALLRNMAAGLNIYEITQKNNMIMFLTKTLDMKIIAKLQETLKGRVVINAGEKSYIGIKLVKEDDPLFIMRETLKLMSGEEK